MAIAWLVANCPACGSVFQKNARNLCPTCSARLDTELQACFQYLYQNRKATLLDLSEHSGCSLKRLTAFIKEGRLPLREFPNLAYDCDLCGEPIREGRLCRACTSRIREQVGALAEPSPQPILKTAPQGPAPRTQTASRFHTW